MTDSSLLSGGVGVRVSLLMACKSINATAAALLLNPVSFPCVMNLWPPSFERTPRVSCVSIILHQLKVLNRQPASWQTPTSHTHQRPAWPVEQISHGCAHAHAQRHSRMNMKGTASQMSKYYKPVHRNTHLHIHTQSQPCQMSKYQQWKKHLIGGRPQTVTRRQQRWTLKGQNKSTDDTSDH